MTDAMDRVLGWFEDGTLLRPDVRALNAVDLSRALALVGEADPGAVPGGRDGGAARIADLIGPADHHVFLLADGLGMSTLERLPPRAFLREQLAVELRSVFPSATASAITSLVTGEWPSRHGVPGWWTYLPEHGLTATALPFVERFGSRPLGELGITTAVYPRAALLAAYRREVCIFQPAHISGSDYTRYLAGETPSCGYPSLSEATAAIVARIRAASGPTYTYFYVPHVDTAAHRFGPDSEQVDALLVALESLLAGFAADLNGVGGRLVLSADHGQIRVPAGCRHPLRTDDELLALLRFPPSGEPRVPLFHVLPGQAERFRDRFEARLGARFALLTADEVEALELLGPGPLADVTRGRIGEFLALSDGYDVLLYRPGEEPDSVEQLVGFHGGLTPDEVRIPLVLA